MAHQRVPKKLTQAKNLSDVVNVIRLEPENSSAGVIGHLRGEAKFHIKFSHYTEDGMAEWVFNHPVVVELLSFDHAKELMTVKVVSKPPEVIFSGRTLTLELGFKEGDEDDEHFYVKSIPGMVFIEIRDKLKKSDWVSW